VNQLVREIAFLYQEYTQSGGVRPFGCSLLVAGVDEAGHHLYQVDPSGTYWTWKATSIGKNSANAKSFLEKRFTPDGEIEDAIHTALLTLKEGFDGKMTPENTEVGRVIHGRFEVLSTEQLRDYLEQI
jgi:20S proteasome subunit alpha 2